MSAAPSPYARTYSFTGFSDATPTIQQPGSQIDAQFDAIALTSANLVSRLSEIQREDGALRNGVVGLEALSAGARFGIAPPTAWATGTAYAVGNSAVNGAFLYLCVVAHTSGAFSTDLADEKWVTLYALGGAETAPAGSVIQSQIGYFFAETAVSGTIPLDTTSPLNTEGTAINYGFTTSQAFALRAPDSLVRLSLQLKISTTLSSGAQLKPIAAIFRSIDSGSYSLVGAFECALDNDYSGLKTKSCFLSGVAADAPGSSLALSYQVRVGTPTGGTLAVGVNTSATLGGNNLTNFLKIEEVKV